MPKDAKLKAADLDDRLGESQQAQEQESARALDSEEVDWEEVDWEEIEKEIEKHPSDYPELCSEAREHVRREATLQRMRRFASEGNWERFKTEFEELPIEEKNEFDQELYSAAMRKFHLGAWQEVLDSTGRDKKGREAFSTALLYQQLHPQDGVESACAQLIVATRDMTLECVRRASTSDALPVRDVELNYAMRGALVMAALIKVFDNHRELIHRPKKTK